jgi:hypothetical protein
MKNDERNKPTEKKVSSERTREQSGSARENINPLKKETMEERARREHWTDIAQSHLGIDE